MPVSSQSVIQAQKSPYAPARILPDRRRHCRVALTLLGQCLMEDRTEYPCKLVVISLSGASVMSSAPVSIDERIVARFSGLSNLDGTVRRVFQGGFTIGIEATQNRRERLAAQLTWLINRHELDGVDARSYERVAADSQAMSILVDGKRISQGKILDISLSGALVKSRERPDVGSPVQIGKRKARVSRHAENGFAVEFVDIDTGQLLSGHFK